jgi:alkylhydroperoxidase family enzyme
VAWNWQSDYEWGLHVGLARSIGMTEAEIRAVARGATGKHWSLTEAALIAAVDDIHDHKPIGNRTWEILAAHYTPEQLVDLVMTVGEFTLVAMILSSFQIAKENIPDLATLEAYR